MRWYWYVIAALLCAAGYYLSGPIWEQIRQAYRRRTPGGDQ